VLTPTEVRVQDLCKEIIAAKTEAEAKPIVVELRTALEEHVRLARESLALQASTIVLLEELAYKTYPNRETEIAA